MRRRFLDDLDLGFLADGLAALVIAIWLAPRGRGCPDPERTRRR